MLCMGINGTSCAQAFMENVAKPVYQGTQSACIQLAEKLPQQGATAAKTCVDALKNISVSNPMSWSPHAKTITGIALATLAIIATGRMLCQSKDAQKV